MKRPKTETLLREVVKVLVEEGGQATMARLYYKLHNKVNLSFHEFAEEVKKSGRFVIIRPPGWENDLVSLKAPEADKRLERAAGKRAEPLRVTYSSCRRCECGELDERPR